ncbi:hypothetical protein C8J57DRAFT_1091609, partial [Mycena rebaudengoi]
VRYNSLVCPTGKASEFRGVDWVEESLINLYTKASNINKFWSLNSRVIEESPFYHNCHRTIERNFCLTSLTRRHAAPDMTKTFASMAPIVEARAPNEARPGRESAYSIPDMLDRGEHVLYNVAERSDVVPDDTVDQVIEEDDLQAEYT